MTGGNIHCSEDWHAKICLYMVLIAEHISARLRIEDLFSQRTYVRVYVVGHAQECHVECR